MLALWQLVYYRRRATDVASVDRKHSGPQFVSEIRVLARMGLGGLALSLMFATGYAFTLDAQIRGEFISDGIVWAPFLVVGGVFQATGWFRLLKSEGDSFAIRVLISVGCLSMLVAVGFLREMLRISKVDLTVVNASVKAAAGVGGFELFVGFTILNIGLMAYCIRLVNRRTTGE